MAICKPPTGTTQTMLYCYPDGSKNNALLSNVIGNHMAEELYQSPKRFSARLICFTNLSKKNGRCM